MPEETRPTNTPTGQATEPAAGLTPEQFKEVAEKVYALMLKDLKISKERNRSGNHGNDRKGRKR